MKYKKTYAVIQNVSGKFQANIPSWETIHIKHVLYSDMKSGILWFGISSGMADNESGLRVKACVPLPPKTKRPVFIEKRI